MLISLRVFYRAVRGVRCSLFVGLRVSCLWIFRLVDLCVCVFLRVCVCLLAACFCVIVCDFTFVGLLVFVR